MQNLVLLYLFLILGIFYPFPWVTQLNSVTGVGKKTMLFFLFAFF